MSSRDVEELMREAVVVVDPTTVFRRVQRYAPALDKRGRPSLRANQRLIRTDETYIRINRPWYYLYRAVDSTGACAGLHGERHP